MSTAKQNLLLKLREDFIAIFGVAPDEPLKLFSELDFIEIDAEDAPARLSHYETSTIAPDQTILYGDFAGYVRSSASLGRSTYNSIIEGLIYSMLGGLVSMMKFESDAARNTWLQECQLDEEQIRLILVSAEIHTNQRVDNDLAE